MKVVISVKEVANGFEFATGKDDVEIYVVEGELNQLDEKALGKVIISILKANS